MSDNEDIHAPIEVTGKKFKKMIMKIIKEGGMKKYSILM